MGTFTILDSFTLKLLYVCMKSPSMAGIECEIISVFTVPRSEG